MPPYIDLDVGDIHYFQRTEFSKLVKTDKINNIETQYNSISDLEKEDYEIIRDYINILTNFDKYFFCKINENNELDIVSFDKSAMPKINHLIIPERIDGMIVAGVYRINLRYNKDLKSVVFPDTVKSINGSLFCNSLNLKRVRLSKNVSSITSAMFYGCPNLEIINTDNITNIDDDAFKSCPKIKNINLEKVERIGAAAFLECELLDVLSMPNIKYIAKNCFYNCNNLEKVSLGDELFYVGENAFSGCIKLLQINLSDKITTIKNRTFERCQALKKIIFPNALRIIEECAFMDSGLEDISLPKSLTLIKEGAFARCPLKNINMYKGTTTRNEAFDYEAILKIKTYDKDKIKKKELEK